MDVDVVVVGAGLAGLLAANNLADLGYSVRVLERAAGPGGRAASAVHAGFTFNLGAHALFCGGALERALVDLAVPLRGGSPRVGLAVIGERAVPMPITARDFFTSPVLDWRGRAAALAWVARVATCDPARLDDRPVSAWLDEISAPDARALASALVRLATYADEPSLQSAGAVVRQLRLPGVRYLDGGWGGVVSALAARAAGRGVEMVHGAGVDEVAGDGARCGASWTRAAAVLVALPLSSARVLLPDLPAAPPVRAAVLDVAVRADATIAAPFVLGVDRPTYASVHSACADLGPGHLIHAVSYLRDGAAATDGELEAEVDRLCPSWRDHVVHRRYLPAITVCSAVDLAARRRPSVDVAAPVWVAGDWVGAEGQLADASAASAARAAAGIARALGPRRAA